MSKQQKRWVIGGFMIMLFVILIAPTLTNKFITVPYIDEQDRKIYNKSISYTDSVYVSGQDSMIHYVKEIYKILDNGRADQGIQRNSKRP